MVPAAGVFMNILREKCVAVSYDVCGPVSVGAVMESFNQIANVRAPTCMGPCRLSQVGGKSSLTGCWHLDLQSTQNNGHCRKILGLWYVVHFGSPGRFLKPFRQVLVAEDGPRSSGSLHACGLITKALGVFLAIKYVSRNNELYHVEVELKYMI